MSVMQRWIARLRDPESKQCIFRLRKGDCFCATGLLADVIDPNGWYLLALPDHFGDFSWHSHISGLSRHYLKKNNIAESDYHLAIFANDRGASFAEISDCLETGDWGTNKELYDETYSDKLL